MPRMVAQACRGVEERQLGGGNASSLEEAASTLSNDCPTGGQGWGAKCVPPRNADAQHPVEGQIWPLRTFKARPFEIHKHVRPVQSVEVPALTACLGRGDPGSVQGARGRRRVDRVLGLAAGLQGTAREGARVEGQHRGAPGKATAPPATWPGRMASLAHASRRWHMVAGLPNWPGVSDLQLKKKDPQTEKAGGLSLPAASLGLSPAGPPAAPGQTVRAQTPGGQPWAPEAR